MKLRDMSSPRSAGENQPAVERGGPSLAAPAGPDANGVSDALDDIAQADILVGDESWQADAVMGIDHFGAIVGVVIHESLLLAWAVSSD
jgi:hypothetical protein